MTKICKNCEFQNQDDYNYCAKCGWPLDEGLPQRNFIVLKANEEYKVNKKALILSYLITIILSWSGFIVGLISKNNHMAVVTFFGFFMPFYLVQSKHPSIRKHGVIQLIISVIGVALSFYVMLKM